MKRLSQTWRQKKSLNTPKQTTTVKKSTTTDKLQLENSTRVFTGFQREIALNKGPTRSLQDKTKLENENDVVNTYSSQFTSPSNSLGVSFGCDFDAAALSEMDRIEQEHVHTPGSTTPIPHKKRLMESDAYTTTHNKDKQHKNCPRNSTITTTSTIPLTTKTSHTTTSSTHHKHALDKTTALAKKSSKNTKMKVMENFYNATSSTHSTAMTHATCTVTSMSTLQNTKPTTTTMTHQSHGSISMQNNLHTTAQFAKSSPETNKVSDTHPFKPLENVLIKENDYNSTSFAPTTTASVASGNVVAVQSDSTTTPHSIKTSAVASTLNIPSVNTCTSRQTNSCTKTSTATNAPLTSSCLSKYVGSHSLKNPPCKTPLQGKEKFSVRAAVPASTPVYGGQHSNSHTPVNQGNKTPLQGKEKFSVRAAVPASTPVYGGQHSYSHTPVNQGNKTPLQGRERISTPIEDSGHVLVSPTSNIPVFSPVNMTCTSMVSEILTLDHGGEKTEDNSENLSNGSDSDNTNDTATSHSSSTSSVLEVQPASGSDVLNLLSWGLPPSVLQRYNDMGITHMFEWQAECLRTGNVLRGGNLVYSAPTSAGKTMVAELLMLKRVLETKRKALFILPYVSVAREKMFYLQRIFQEAGIRVEGFMGSHNPAGGFAAVDIAVCTIEKANSLLNRLMEENKVSTLGVVVVDEMHMIGDTHRGYLLELFLTKIRFMTGEGSVQGEETVNQETKSKSESAIQVVCMSATLPNLDMLAHWLAADLYFTEHRPVPLTEMVKIGPTIYDKSMKKIREIDPAKMVTRDDDHIIPLCKETITQGHSVLIFCPTKNWCEKQAEAIARHFSTIGNVALSSNKNNQAVFVKASELVAFDYEGLREVYEQLKRTPVGVDSVLRRVLPYGVAYHHAGLTVDERDIIEGAFRQGTVRVLIATSTLCSGVNLPARRVIIRTPTFHGKMVDPLVYKQMAGRAGRKGVDDLGESILVCKTTERHKAETLMKTELKPVKSCLLLKELNGGIKRALLEVIASGVVTGLHDVERYAACTFFASSSRELNADGNNCAISETIRFLVDNEFIRVQANNEKTQGNEESSETEQQRYVPTQLGAATVASALSPDEALVVFGDLQKARKCFVLESELHIIYQVTPIYVEAQWPNLDWNQFLTIWERLPSNMRRVADIVGIQEVYLSLASRGRIPTKTPEQRQRLRVHRRFFAALALQDLVHEVPLNEVARRYGATRGMVQSLQTSASTFAGMVTVFCQKLGWVNLDLLLSQFQSRLSFGVERELCDLVRITVLNAARARMLYNAGFQTIASLASAKPEVIETILRNAAPFISERKHLGETDTEVKHRSEARVIWVAGKKGLSEREAAALIVDEAKQHLQNDAAQLGIQWKPPEVKLPELKVPEMNVETQAPQSETPRVHIGPREIQPQSTLGNHSKEAIGKKRRYSNRRRLSGPYRNRKSPPLRRSPRRSPNDNSNRANEHISKGPSDTVPNSALPDDGNAIISGNVTTSTLRGNGSSTSGTVTSPTLRDNGNAYSITVSTSKLPSHSNAISSGYLNSVTEAQKTSQASISSTREGVVKECANLPTDKQPPHKHRANESDKYNEKTQHTQETSSTRNLHQDDGCQATKPVATPVRGETTKRRRSPRNKQQNNSETTRNRNTQQNDSNFAHKNTHRDNSERTNCTNKSSLQTIPQQSSETTTDQTNTKRTSSKIYSQSNSVTSTLNSNTEQSPPRNPHPDNSSTSRSTKKRRSPRHKRRSVSPVEKIPRVESSGCKEDPLVNKTQSFTAQDESCSSGLLFDNTMDVSEDKVAPEPSISPELYSEPLGDDNANAKGGECYEESQALGFSMSDSYLAQCGGMSQMNTSTQRKQPNSSDQREVNSNTAKEQQQNHLVDNRDDHCSSQIQQQEQQKKRQLRNQDEKQRNRNDGNHLQKQTKQNRQVHQSKHLHKEEQSESPAEPQNQFYLTSSISDDLMAQHCDILLPEIDGNKRNAKTCDKNVKGLNQNHRQNNDRRIMEDDGIVGEFDSGGQFGGGKYRSGNRSGPCSPVNTCALASTSQSPNPQAHGREEEPEGLLEISGSFSLNLSLSGSPCDESENIINGTQDKSDENNSTCVINEGFRTIVRSENDCLQNSMNSQKKTKRADMVYSGFCRGKIADERSAKVRESNKDYLLDEALCFSSDSLDLHCESILKKADLQDNVCERNFTSIKSYDKNCDTPSNVAKGSCKAVHIINTPEILSNSSHDENDSSTTSSPPLPTPASPLCSYSSVTIADVTGNELLFHHFIKEWKARKEYSIAIGCERILGNVPTIGGRFNKGPSKASSQRGIPIEGSDDAVVGLAVCWGGRDAYYVSLQDCSDVTGDADESVAMVVLPLEKRIAEVKSVLECKGKRKGVKFCFDSTAHYKALAQSCGITLTSDIADPKVAAWLINPSSKEKSLHNLAAEFMGDKTDLLEGTGAGFGCGSLGLASQSHASGRERSCTEAVIAYWLMKGLGDELKKTELDQVFDKVEMPVMRCLARMELNGIGFSETECERLKSILQAKLGTLEETAYKMANRSFSLTSPDDVAAVLFFELKLPVDGKPDETGEVKRRTLGTSHRAPRGRKHLKMSTNKEVLERLKAFHPLPGVILEWRRVNCALTKVVYPVQREKMHNSRANMSRIYTTAQIHTATGRVSFAEPNLQNVPRDFEIDFAGALPQEAQQVNNDIIAVSMRNTFVPFEGGVMLAADYSQLELRLIAHLASDQRLIKLLNAGGDVFRMIAGSLNAVEPTAVTDVQRQQAKQICYGIIYGIGAKSLGEQLKVNEDDASVFIEKFKARFSGIRKYLKTTVDSCRKDGYVMTVTKRRRYLPGINSTNVHARSQAERQAVNTTVQGSAADLVKMAMINIDQRLGEMFPASRTTLRHKIVDRVEVNATPRRRSTRISAQTPRKRTSSHPSIKGAFVVLQLHDELILEVSERDLHRVAAMMKKEMETAMKLSVVLPVKLKAGPSWGSMTSLEV